MSIADYVDDLFRAMGFLSRITLPQRFFLGHDGSLSRTVQAFPIAGGLIALPVAASLGVLSALHVDVLLAAFVALGLQALITGCLHEDGLCDMADGFGGGRSRDAILTIMRDSRIGTYGAVALILSFGIRVAALASIAATLSPVQAALAIVAVGSISRTAMVWHWSMSQPARMDGVAVSVGAPEARSAFIAYVSGGLSCAVLIAASVGLPAAVAVLLVTAGLTYAHTRNVIGKIGGHTGDTIGASQQISEMAALSALALFV